jgi:hypothetical protein
MKKMIAKNILLGLFVLVYGIMILYGLVAGLFFPLDSGVIAEAVTSDNQGMSMGTRLFISFVFIWLAAYFILEAMTSRMQSKVDTILHIILGLEMSFYGVIALWQGGDWWLGIFIVVGVITFLFGYNKLRRISDGSNRKCS